MPQADLVIVGAGPAGMAAAAEAAAKGLTVTILDEQRHPGGQVYRDVDRVAPLRGTILGPDFSDGLALTAGLRRDGIKHLGGAVVWAIEAPGRVAYTVNGRSAIAHGRRVLMATGALERPMPLPGWTLPGVMTVGAGQILLKQSGMLCRRAVLAGSGPLLYLLAAQMVRAGTPPLALVETQTRGHFLRALSRIGGALRGWRYLVKGAAMLRLIRRAGVPRYPAADGLRVEGRGRAEAIRFVSGAKERRITCDTVLLHHGVVPNTQAARSVGVPHRWDGRQACFVPDCDAWGRTGVGDLYIAGDGAGIGGAEAAAHAGRLAALAIAADLGVLEPADRDRRAAPHRRALSRALAARPFLDIAYPPYGPSLSPADATVVCRCEEVTAGEIRHYAATGCSGPNQTKAFGRAGMGPCQGRYCGLTVTALLAASHGATPDETGYYRIRPPLKPVTLGEVAALETASLEAGEHIGVT